MKIVPLTGNPAALAYVKARTGMVPAGEYRLLGATDDKGDIVGVVGYDRFMPNSVRIHVAADGIPPRALVAAAFEYPFLEMDKGVLLAEIPMSRFKALRMAHKHGFVVRARVSDGWAVGDDLIIMELRRETWRGKADQNV